MFSHFAQPPPITAARLSLTRKVLKDTNRLMVSLLSLESRTVTGGSKSLHCPPTAVALLAMPPVPPATCGCSMGATDTSPSSGRVLRSIMTMWMGTWFTTGENTPTGKVFFIGNVTLPMKMSHAIHETYYSVCFAIISLCWYFHPLVCCHVEIFWNRRKIFWKFVIFYKKFSVRSFSKIILQFLRKAKWKCYQKLI